MCEKIKPNFIIRELKLDDCEEVRNIWTEVGFVIAKYINEVMMKIDPKGILVAQDIETEELLGVCSGVNLSSNFAFIGQYAVRPKYQGLGIGSALWKKVMEHIGTERNISLSPAEKMSQTYQNKCGFVIVPEKRIQIYVGKANCDSLIKQLTGVSLVLINEHNVISVSEYDKEICDGLYRRQLIEEYCKTPETICLAAVNKEDHRIIGYSIMTATNSEMVTVEPLYADNEQIAELLIGKCCDFLPIAKTNGILLLCWDSNQKAIALAKKMGLNFQFDQQILFTKQLVEGKTERKYIVTVLSVFTRFKYLKHIIV